MSTLPVRNVLRLITHGEGGARTNQEPKKLVIKATFYCLYPIRGIPYGRWLGYAGGF